VSGTVYIERIAADYLRDHGIRARATNPSDANEPWVRITLLDPQLADGRDPADHLINYLVQFDCYGGAGQASLREAHELAIKVRTLLHEMPEHEHDGAQVTEVLFSGGGRIPDTDNFSPARERVIVTAQIYACAID